MQAKIVQMEKKELKKFTNAQAAVQKNLATFDELDFKVFSHRDLDAVA